MTDIQEELAKEKKAEQERAYRKKKATKKKENKLTAKKAGGKPTFGFFNERPIKKDALSMYQAIEEAQEKTLAEYDSSVDEIWVTIPTKYKSLERAWDYPNNDEFKRFWLDQLVKEFSYMIWNAVYETHGGDKKADKKANAANDEFRKMFL